MVPESDFEPEVDAFAPDVEDFAAEDDALGADALDAAGFDGDVPERVVVPFCDCVTCATNFLALSRTVSPTSPARLIAKSLTVWTPSWTFGWFQTSSAAFRICS